MIAVLIAVFPLAMAAQAAVTGIPGLRDPAPSQAVRGQLNRPTVMPTRAVNRVSEQTRLETEARRGQVFLGLVSRLTTTTEARLENYGQFLERVRTRKQKYADMGKDVTRVERFIATAQTNLTAAGLALTNFKNAAGAIDLDAVSPGEARKQLTGDLAALKQAMTTLHTSMAGSVAEIRNLVGATPKVQPTRLPTQAAERYRKGIENPDRGIGE